VCEIYGKLFFGCYMPKAWPNGEDKKSMEMGINGKKEGRA
jgi:hypothetical protein